MSRLMGMGCEPRPYAGAAGVWQCLRRQDRRGGPGPGPHAEPERQTEVEERESIRCRECGCEITTRDDAVEIDGKHEHTFFNPAGILFHIACFAAAPGCANEGAPTAEFSWFAGYSWCYSFCAACRGHLGWQFLSAQAPVFWGLILDRLLVGAD